MLCCVACGHTLGQYSQFQSKRKQADKTTTDKQQLEKTHIDGGKLFQIHYKTFKRTQDFVGEDELGIRGTQF